MSEEKIENMDKTPNFSEERIDKLYESLAKAQLEIESTTKDKSGQHKNKYASIDSVCAACRVILAKHGLTVQEEVLETETGRYTLITWLVHKSGQRQSYKMPLIVDKQGGCHGFKSGLTYARRCALTSLLMLSEEESDDDGNAAMPKNTHKIKEKININQILDLQEVIKNVPEKSLEGIFKYFKIDKLENLFREKFDEAKKILIASAKGG